MARVTLALALVLFTCASARAQTTPTEAIQDVFARANEILTDPATAGRPLDRWLAMRKLVSEAFDFRGAAELASGDHWQARTAAEQEEFTWLFADLLERAFVARVAAGADLSGGAKVKYLIEAVDGDTARVMTSLGRKAGRDLLLGYRLIERGGAWKITDVTMDGVSIMANYRAQLDRVLGTASFPELLTQMRAMVGVAEPAPGAKLAADAESPAAITDVQDAPPPAAITERRPPADTAPPLSAVAIAHLRLPEPEIHLATFASPAAPPMVPAVIEESRPRASAKAPSRPLTTKAYWLRIMTTATPDEAGRLVRRLRDGKHSVGLERKTVSGKLLLHVRVGPFQDAEEAVLELLALQTKGHDPYLIAERDNSEGASTAPSEASPRPGLRGQSPRSNDGSAGRAR